MIRRAAAVLVVLATAVGAFALASPAHADVHVPGFPVINEEPNPRAIIGAQTLWPYVKHDRYADSIRIGVTTNAIWHAEGTQNDAVTQTLTADVYRNGSWGHCCIRAPEAGSTGRSAVRSPTWLPQGC